MATSTSTTSTSLRKAQSISPKDIRLLQDYQLYHRSKQYESKNESPSQDPFLQRYVKSNYVLDFKTPDTPNDIYSKYISKNLNAQKPGKKFNRRLSIPKKKNNALTVFDQKGSEASTETWPTISQHYISPNKREPKSYIKNTLSVDVATTPSKTLTKKVPQNFLACPVNDLIVLVSRMLENLINLNDKLVPDSVINGASADNKKNSLLTRYHSRTPPNISVINYVSRLTKFNNFSSANLLTCIYYIDLLSYNYQPFFTLNSWTVHRFLLVATMVSQKSMEDYFFTNEHYAKVGGVALNELNYLEIDFLQRVNWKCIPYKTLPDGSSSIRDSREVLDMYYKQLIELMGQNCKENEYVYVIETESDDTQDNHHLANDGVFNDYYSVDKSKFNRQGYSVDASSSPHLKRKHPNL